MPDNRSRISSIMGLMVFVVIGLGLFYFRDAGMGPAGPQAEAAVRTIVSVQFGAIGRGTLRNYATLYGRVEAAPAAGGQPAGLARVGSPVSAIVSAVNCGEGQHVEKGQTLFTLDTRAADVEIARARQLLDARQKSLDKLTAPAQGTEAAPAWILQQAADNRDLARADLDRALAGRQLLTVTAPISGTITRIAIHSGDAADPNAADGLVEIVDLDRLVVNASVPAAYLDRIKSGQQARVDSAGTEIGTSPAIASAAAFDIAQGGSAATTQPSGLAGTVNLVDAALDPTTGLGSVDIMLGAGTTFRPETIFRPGQFVRVRIILEEHADCLMVPAASIVPDGSGNPRIGIINPDGHSAVLFGVQTGIREGDWVELKGEGLEAGQAIVTTGAAKLVPRTEIRREE